MAESTLSASIDPILTEGVTAQYDPKYTIYIHTPTQDLTPLMFQAIDTLRDYNESIAEYMVVEFTIASGDFFQYMFPYKDSLEISIKRELPNYEYECNRYKMVIINQLDTDANTLNNLSPNVLNATELKTISCQCIDKNVNAIRHIYAEGIFSKCKLEDIIMGSMVKKLDQTVLDGQPLSSNMKFDVYPADNQLQYEQVIIPTGVKLVDLPSYLQNDKKYGLYNYNVGTFFQMMNDSPTYFVYPLYDTTRVVSPKTGYENQKRLVVVIPDKHTHDFSETTYMINGDEIRVLAGNNVKLVDTGENELIDGGDGYVVSKPEAIMTSNVTITDAKVTAAPDDGLNSVILKERRDGVDGVRYTGNNANNFKVRSDYKRATLAKYQLTWNHCNMNLLYPGMPVNIIKSDSKSGIVTIAGVLQGTYSRYNNLNKSITGLLFITAEKQAVYRELTDTE